MKVKVGSLVRVAHHNRGRTGIVVKVNLRDISFYKSHTYLVQFFSGRERWLVSSDLEVVSESR